MYTLVGAVEKLSIEQLYSNNSEDELEQYVHYENIEHILEGVDDAVEHRLQLGYPLDGLEGPQHTQHSQ